VPGPIPLVVHMSHEAGVSAGGISAVLGGLLVAPAYMAAVARTVVVGALHGADSMEMERLLHPRNGLSIDYSSLHGIFNGVPGTQIEILQQVERAFGVAILYGTRRFGGAAHEVLLIDATRPDRKEVDLFKYQCWERFGLDSARHEQNLEFDLYMALAPALFAALRGLGIGEGIGPGERIILAHEWMGIPLVLAAQLAEPGRWRTVFYAHEVATARRLIEERSGHDTAFYNALFAAKAWNVSLETVYGSQNDYFKHALIRLAARCDAIFAVGDLVIEELRFLGGRFSKTPIDLVYNGIPAQNTRLSDKHASKAKLQQYAANLLGYTPDFVFTHFARTIISKAFWRDLRVLAHLDGMLAEAGETAVLFLLTSSVAAGRPREWVLAWEEEYGWPVTHRRDNGDLLDQEVPLYADGIEPFNRQASNVRVVLVNQSVWRLEHWGRRLPAEMDFVDLRRGTDVEFGQSIYEPFGIAQVEPLTYGALSCVSSVCGSVGFVDRTVGLTALPNLIVADYVSLPTGYWLRSPYDALAIDQGVRDWVEQESSRRVAQQLFARLPRSDADHQALLETGCAAATRMSWDVVVHDYLLPCLKKVQSAQARD
jgi:hypothetical protein